MAGVYNQIEEPTAMPSEDAIHIAIELSVASRLVAVRLPGADKSRLRSWERDMAELRTGDGRMLPILMQAELNRFRRLLVPTLELMREMEAERIDAQIAATEVSTTRKIIALQQIRGIGANFSTVLVREAFYRSFGHRRQLASYV